MEHRGRPPGRSPTGRRELRKRQVQARTAIGRQVGDLRSEFGVTQVALAAAAGVDQAHVSRIERGMAVASLDTLIALACALGADLSIRLFPTSAPRIRDHLQAPMVDALIRRLDRRWPARPEVPVPAARGVIDLVLRLRGGELAIACEAHSELRSVERVLRRLAEKTVALGDVGPPRLPGALAAPASSLLVVRASSKNREIAIAYAATLEAAFPGNARFALDALTGPTAPWPGPTLLWVRLGAGHAEVLDRPPRGVRVGRSE